MHLYNSLYTILLCYLKIHFLEKKYFKNIYFYIFNILINENYIFQKIQLCLIKFHWLKVIENS